MKAFLVGLLVLVIFGIFSIAGLLLFPLFLLLGFFLRWILACAVLLFMVWLIGKLTLVAIDAVQRRRPPLDGPKSEDKLS